MQSSNVIEINPVKPARSSIIWLHGLGADGHDFLPIAAELDLPESAAARFIFPHAPVRPITINNHQMMRGWYDIFALSINAQEDETGIEQSRKIIEDLILQEHQRGIAYQNIILAGFSQGGAMALHTALHFPQPIGGIIALSCYVPLARKILNQANLAATPRAIFMGHGEYDAIVSLRLGEFSQRLLVQLGHAVDWRTYPMEHSVCAEEIMDIKQWLEAILTRSD